MILLNPAILREQPRSGGSAVTESLVCDFYSRRQVAYVKCQYCRADASPLDLDDTNYPDPIMLPSRTNLHRL